MSTYKKLTTIGAVAALAIGLAACGGGDDDTAMMCPEGQVGTYPDCSDPPVPPTPYETASAAIAAADTEEAAQAAYDAVKDDVTASEGEMLQMKVDERIAAIQMAARADAQKMALTTAAGGVDTSDLMTQPAIDAAQMAIDALQAAIDAADDIDDTSMYQTMVDNAQMAVDTAQMAFDTGNRMTMQLAAISNAVTAARTAVGMVNDTADDAAVTDADDAVAALGQAIADAADVPDGNADKAGAQGTLDTLTSQLASAKTSRQAAIDAAAEAARLAAEAEAEEKAKEMAAAGKALKGALGTDPLGHLSSTTLARTGLTITPGDRQTDGTITAGTAFAELKAGDSAGSLGDWAGTNYRHYNAGTKIENTAVVYTNRAAPKSYPIAERYATTDNVPGGAGTYTAADRTLTIATDTADPNIKADGFPTAGTTTFTPASPSAENIVPGTYQGASGNYRCTGTCTAMANANGDISLSDAWVFVHDMGATVSVADTAYLYFGWWLQKDDGDPEEASAFTGVVGTIADLTANPSTLNGTATYSGPAAGKFAMSDPLTGGDAGHFTADATISATFGTGPTNGLSGTIDNFMANEEAVPWSVTLYRRTWHATNVGQTEAFDNTSTAAVNESVTQTVWSIDGNSAAASGTWDAMAYDELPGETPTGDGSNVPTSVTGTFQSHFGSTHTMVGAFGATKD